jgi:hypothetical protein
MKGSPRSLWLSWANRAASQAAGFWSGVFASAVRRGQADMMKAMTTPPMATPPKARPGSGSKRMSKPSR